MSRFLLRTTFGLLTFLIYFLGAERSANAGSATNQIITSTLIEETQNWKGQDGVFFVIFPTANLQPPSCASGQNTRFAVNPATDGGKALMAALLTAYAQKRPVSVQGSGACDIWPDTETILYIQTF